MPWSLPASKLASGNGMKGGDRNEKNQGGRNGSQRGFYTHTQFFCLVFLGYIYFLLVSEVPALDNYYILSGRRFTKIRAGETSNSCLSHLPSATESSVYTKKM